MSIHDARPGPEWYWIYDKNREKWIDRRKYTFDKATNTFVADYSYRLKWIQWILLLFITAAIIVGIIFGVKSANSKDDGGIKTIPASAYDNVDEDFDIQYPDQIKIISGHGIAEITPKNTDYFKPVPNVEGLGNDGGYLFTLIAKEGYQFSDGSKETEVLVSKTHHHSKFAAVPDITYFLNTSPIGVTDTTAYKENNPNHQAGVFHPVSPADTWQMRLPTGWAWNDCSTGGDWISVKGDNKDFILEDSNGTPLKVVRCNESKSVEFVDKDAGYKLVSSSNPKFNKPFLFKDIPPITDIPDQTGSFLKMDLNAEDAAMGEQVLKSVNEMAKNGLIDRSQLAWIYIGLSGLKTESYHFNGVDWTNPNVEKVLREYENDLTLNTLVSRYSPDAWGNNAPDENTTCNTAPVELSFWEEQSQLFSTPLTDYRTIFATDKHENISNLPTIKVFQLADDHKYYWAKFVSTRPDSKLNNFEYVFTNSSVKTAESAKPRNTDLYYHWEGGTYKPFTPENPTQNFWLCQIRSRPNSVIIPAFWPQEYKSTATYGFSEEKYIDAVLNNELSDSDAIIATVKSISDESGSYFPYVTQEWAGNETDDKIQLKQKAIVSLLHWLYPAVLLNNKSVPNYQDFTKYIPNKNEQYWTQGMKDTFDEISSASLAVASSHPVSTRALDPDSKSTNVTAAEFDKIWKPFEKLWFHLVHPDLNGAHAFWNNDLKQLIYTGIFNSYNWGIVNGKDELGPIGRINSLLNSLISQDIKQINKFIPIKTNTSITSIFAPNEGFIDLGATTMSSIDLGLIQIKFEKNMVDFNSNLQYKSLINSQWTNPVGANPSKITDVFTFLNSMNGKDSSNLIHNLVWGVRNFGQDYKPTGFLQYLSKAVVQSTNHNSARETYNVLLGNANNVNLKDVEYEEFEKYDVLSYANTLVLSLLNNNWTTTLEELYKTLHNDSIQIRPKDPGNYQEIKTFDEFVERIWAFMEGSVTAQMIYGDSADANRHNFGKTGQPAITEWPTPLGTTLPWPK